MRYFFDNERILVYFLLLKRNSDCTELIRFYKSTTHFL
jgi:hypothetical protein